MGMYVEMRFKPLHRSLVFKVGFGRSWRVSNEKINSPFVNVAFQGDSEKREEWIKVVYRLKR